ncbi:MAG: hypothetical protein V4673_16810, partial [Pseudomonadota bacterium]
MTEQQRIILRFAQRLRLMFMVSGRRAQVGPQRRQQRVLLPQSAQTASEHVPGFVVIGMPLDPPPRLVDPSPASHHRLGDVVIAHALPRQAQQPRLRGAQPLTAGIELRVALQRAFQHHVATLSYRHPGQRQNVAHRRQRRIVEPLQRLDQRLRIAQRRQPAAKPAQHVVEPLRAPIEYARPKRERSPGPTDAFPGLMDPRMPCLAFLRQAGLRLQQLPAGECHQTRPDGRVFIERCHGSHGDSVVRHRGDPHD